MLLRVASTTGKLVNVNSKININMGRNMNNGTILKMKISAPALLFIIFLLGLSCTYNIAHGEPCKFMVPDYPYSITSLADPNAGCITLVNEEKNYTYGDCTGADSQLFKTIYIKTEDNVHYFRIESNDGTRCISAGGKTIELAGLVNKCLISIHKNTFKFDPETYQKYKSGAIETETEDDCEGGTISNDAKDEEKDNEMVSFYNIQFKNNSNCLELSNDNDSITDSSCADITSKNQLFKGVYYPCTRSTPRAGDTKKAGVYNFFENCFIGKGWNNPTSWSKLMTSDYYDYDANEYVTSYKARHPAVDVMLDVRSKIKSLSPGKIKVIERDDRGAAEDKDGNILIDDDGSLKKVNDSNFENLSRLLISHYYVDKKNNKISEFCGVYGHVYANNNIEIGSIIKKDDELGVSRLFGGKNDKDHLHMAVNINGCSEETITNWGVINKTIHPDDKGFVNPFNWLANHEPSKVGLLENGAMEDKTTDAIVSCYNSQGGITGIGMPFSDNSGTDYLHKWNEIYLQNFRIGDEANNGPESAIFVNKETDKVHAFLVKGAFWIWYKTSGHNSHNTLGYPVTNEFAPSELCVKYDSFLDVMLTKIEVNDLGANTTYTIVSRQNFQNGVLLWAKSDNTYKILRISKDDKDKVYVYDDGMDTTPDNYSYKISENIGLPYGKSVQYLIENDIVKGYDDGLYRPDNKINRAEFVMILNSIQSKMSGKDEVNKCTEEPFPDVSCDSWFCPSVYNAKAKGIIGGYDDGLFKPGNQTNKAEASKILAIAFYPDEMETTEKKTTFYKYGCQKNSSSDEDNGRYQIFSDITEPEAWYCGYVNLLINKNIILPLTNKNGGYGIGSEITRGEMANYVCRYLVSEEKTNDKCNKYNEFQKE